MENQLYDTLADVIEDFIKSGSRKRGLYFYGNETPLPIPEDKVIKVEISYESKAKLENRAE